MSNVIWDFFKRPKPKKLNPNGTYFNVSGEPLSFGVLIITYSNGSKETIDLDIDGSPKGKIFVGDGFTIDVYERLFSVDIRGGEDE